VDTWFEQRAVLKALRSPSIETRRAVVRDLEHKSPAFARAYLVEALGDRVSMYELRRATRWRTMGMSRGP